MTEAGEPGQIDPEPPIKQLTDAFELLIGRPPPQRFVASWTRQLSEGATVEDGIAFIVQRPGFTRRYGHPAGRQPAATTKINTGGLDDDVFLRIVFETLIARTAPDAFTERWSTALRLGTPMTEAIARIVNLKSFQRRIPELVAQHDLNQVRRSDPTSVRVMGTDTRISRDEWDRRLLDVLLDRDRRDDLPHLRTDLDHFPLLSQRSREDTEPLITIVTSLFRGGRYIADFLENITSQVGFEACCELSIIDADSPDGERATIREYQRRFPNIRYQRCGERIGIYEAWNLAVHEARGEFATSANIDDLRRRDCIAWQAETLLGDPTVDVVYQDFFYAFRSGLDFQTIAACGVQSHTPAIVPTTLLYMNPPHCAPMWRLSIHEEVGLFDASLQSAADWEMWLRCAAAGMEFGKIDLPLIAYFNNPEGVSTRPDTVGHIEGSEVRQRYLPILARAREATDGEFTAESRRALGLPDPPPAPIADLDREGAAMEWLVESIGDAEHPYVELA